MPILGSDETLYQAAPRVSGGELTVADMQASAERVNKTYSGSAILGGAVAFAPLDLIDTAASSLSLGSIQRGSINESALRMIDMPGLTDFYNENKGAIEIASGIGGIVAADVVAKRLLKPAGAFLSVASKLPYIRRVAALDAEYATALSMVRNVDKGLAARGALGVEQYVGKVAIDGVDVARNSAVNSAKRLGFFKGARHAVATEAVMGATLSQNSFLYDESAAHNLMWMGLGVGVGGAVDWLHTAYSIRKSVNSDEMRRVFAGALDPGGAEESRLLWHGKKINPDLDAGSFLGGSFSDRATSFLVGATNLVDSKIEGTAEDVRALVANRTSLATQQRELARMEAQKITTKGISTNGFTRFSMDSRGFGNHLDMMMYRDAGSLYGTEMIGGVADDMTVYGVHESHVARVEERIKETERRLAEPDLKPEDAEKLQTLRKRLDYEQKLTPMAAIDGEWMPISEAAAIEGFIEPDIRFTETARRGVKGEVKGFVKGEVVDKHGIWIAKTENPAGNVSLDSDLVWHIPGGKNLDKADHFDVLRLYRLGQRAIPEIAKFKHPIVLPKKPDWFTLDMAEEVLKLNPQANVVFPSGMTRESAQVESMVQKAEALKKHSLTEDQMRLKKGESFEGNISKLRVRYNIPRLTAYERGLLNESEHPVEQLLRGVGTFGADEVRKMSLTQIKEEVAKFKRLGDLAPATAKDVESLTGNSFRYMLDDKGNPLKPLIAYKRPFQDASWSADHVAERIAANKIQTIKTLTDGNADPVTKAIAAGVMQSDDFDLAARTHELMDTQIQGSIAGVAPQNPFGAARNALVSSEWRDRDSPIMLAATRLRETVNRQVRDFMKVTVETAFGDSLSLLKNPRNASSKVLLDQFHTFRSGWDVAAKPVKNADGFWSFNLLETPENKKRFKEVFGAELAEGQPLLSPTGKEVVLDELGLSVQQRFNSVTETVRQMKNTLLRANGRSEIATRQWFTPPPGTQGKYIGFVLGPDGRVVPNMTVIESTPEAFAKSRDALTPELNKKGLGYIFRTQEEIRNFANIWDKAQMDFIDPGTTAIQPGKTQRGGLAGSEVRVGAFDESMQYIQDNFLRHGNDMIETLMKDQINAAKARSAIASEVTQNKASVTRNIQNRSIYDFYLENLTGSSKLASSKSFVGRIYNSIEGTLDKFLEAGTPPVSKVWIATNDWIGRRTPWQKGAAAKKDFETLSAKLGQHMPFESTAQMLERQGAGATPPTLAGITGKMNQFTAAVLLRVAEVAHPIMNMSGILNAMPSVIRHVSPRDGESVKEFADRVGHSAMIFNLADGSATGALDMAKMATRGFKRAWSRAADADYEYMVRNGFLSQEVAEFQRQFGAIQGKSEWNKFFMGDSSAKGFKSKGLVGWLSVLSDKSEDFSRSWGHMVGLEMAETLGIKSREARHAFAHDLANKMIANYSPHNRPEIFQGALGAPIGLFQSFILNYYQRMFRYVETKDGVALGTQMATQASLFGVTGLPGWTQFNAIMTDKSGGDDPESGIWTRFGQGAGDLLGNGVLSNIPKIFGAEGVDLYSRGDVNPRIPGVPTGSGTVVDSIPGLAATYKMAGGAVEVLNLAWRGIGEGLGLFKQENPGLSSTRFAEVVSNMMANRPIAGMVEQFFAGGNDTDRYGQLVSETKGAAETAYRLIGLRSERQSNELRAFYATKNAQALQSAQKEGLRLSTRSAMRAGNWDALPEIFNRYVETGGDPRYWRRWLKDNYEAATNTRSERQLDQVMNDESRVGDMIRLLDAGVSIAADEDPNLTTEFQQSDATDDLSQDDSQLGVYQNQMLTSDAQ
jgi:hypothetical protein